MERVWDRFLTDTDKAVIRASGARPEHRRDPDQRPALLLIDLYRAVFGDGPEPLVKAVERWPSSCGPAAWAALPHIQGLLSACRAAALPIVHVTGMSNSGIDTWNREGRPAPRVGKDTDPDSGLRYEIMEQVAPLPGEVVLRKATPSPFWGTPLMAHLTARGVNTVIVCGESTSGCVRATVVDASTARLNVTVPEECVFDRHEAAHAINLFDMHHKYADVVPLQEVLELVGRRER